MKRDSFEVTIANFEWINRNKLPLDTYLPSKPYAVSFGCPARQPLPRVFPAQGCCQLLCPATSSPAAHHGSQAAPAPVFSPVILNEPGSGKDGLEQHVLPLSDFNGRPVCPGQLMGTRTCQGVRPPRSAAATASEPAGAFRSRAAPGQPGSRGQL